MNDKTTCAILAAYRARVDKWRRGKLAEVYDAYLPADPTVLSPGTSRLAMCHRFSANTADYMAADPAPRWPGDTEEARARDIAQCQADAIGWASR